MPEKQDFQIPQELREFAEKTSNRHGWLTVS